MTSHWRIHPADPQAADALARVTQVDPLTAQVLLNRGMRDGRSATRFLAPTVETFDDPFAVPGMHRAIPRLQRAIAQQEPILIFSDSDVDGLTASVILYEALCQQGALVRVKISNRIEDGHGLPNSLVRQVCCSSTGLAILVDCGTNQPDAVEQLAAHGIDTIIADHHLPLASPAQPYALINPHCYPDSRFRELCSAGLAFKIAHALCGDAADERMASLLDLAALGTLADYSPLLGESRVLVANGLSRIVESHRPGLQRLCEATDTLDPVPDQILKRLVPRLNASGRLGDAGAVWSLLRDEKHARLEEWMTMTAAAHAQTKALRRQIAGEAQAQVQRLHFRDQYVLVVSRSGWHQGLMGPLAAQLAEQYSRPAIAIAMDEARGTGSGRSVPMFNLLEALQACHTLLERFGGHAQACGLTVGRTQLEPFRVLVNQQAHQRLGSRGMMRTQTADLELPLSAVHQRWVHQLERFAPFGQGNPRPTVVLRHLTIERRSPRIATLSDDTVRMEAKGTFPALSSGGRYDVMAAPAISRGELVLMVQDVKVSTAPSAPAPI